LNIITRVWSYNRKGDSFQLDTLDNATSLDEASQRLVGGVYTTLRTYQHNKALHLQDHFDRLENSVKLQGRDITFPREHLRDAIRGIIHQYPGGDVRMRVHCSLLPDDYHLYFMAEPFIPYPDDSYTNGVSAMLLEMQRQNPGSKATNFIDLTGDIRRKKPAGINEYLMTGSGHTLLEGMSSNIFVVKDRTIWTAGEGILPGITRQMALSVINGLNLDVTFNGYPVDKLQDIDELFITSASRGVMPVTRIDDLPVGAGIPGPITMLVRSEFDRQLQSELEPV
jgi:branched-subunit amino acid aminotransferase/4-amino-4-deoxychorismate lyase